MATTNANRPDWLPHLLGTTLIVAIVVALAAVAVRLEKQRYLERATVATGNLALLLAGNVAEVFEKAGLALEAARVVYRQQSAGGSVDVARLESLLADLETAVPEIDTIRIMDARGLVRWGRGVPKDKPTDLSDRHYYRKLRDEPAAGLVVEGPVFARISKEWVLVAALRLEDPAGRFAGVVYAVIPTAALQPILASAALGPQGAATIRGTDLALVQRVPDTRNAVGSRTVSKELRDAILAHPEGGEYIATTAIDGIERSNAYRRIGNYPYYTLVGLATSDFLGNWKQNVVLIGGLALLTTGISAYASLLGYRSQRRLSSELNEKARLNDELRISLDERKLLNERLAVRAREAEAANSAKTAFLANMSHEMRTPLNHILGYASLARLDPASPKLAQRLDGIENAGKRMTAMISRILDLTRIEAQAIDLAEDPIDPGALLAGLAADAATAAAAKGLKLEVAPAPAVDLIGDRRHLGRALANYVDNAVRFTATGSIGLACRIEEESEHAALLRFEVTDTGEGIAPEHLARLFTIFEQVDNSSTRRHGGLGVGLAMTRRISQALGGDAGCESRVGEGSRFWFTARLRKRPAGSPGSAQAVNRPTQGSAPTMGN